MNDQGKERGRLQWKKSKAFQNGEIIQLQRALVEVHDLIYFCLSQRARLDCILNQQDFGRIVPVASDVDTTNVHYNSANGRSNAPQFRNPLTETVQSCCEPEVR